MKNEIKKIFVLSTAMLSFISFWRAASIVLCDFGSSAYYAGGIGAKSFGEAYPYFILAVMLFSGLMLMAYIESSSLFTRGGVYVMVKETMGKSMAKLSVSALIFDYLLTGPISSVSAGLYLASFLNLVLPKFINNFHINNNFFAVLFSLLVVLYFWRENIKGVKESSDNNVKIIIFVMFAAIILFAYSILTIYHKGFSWPKFNLNFSKDALGWTAVLGLKPIGLFGIFMAFGQSILALSGLETLGQVYREIEDPKIKNLKKTVVVIFIFSLFFTGILTFLSAVIVPYEKVVNLYSDNLLSGMVMEMIGPYWLKISVKTLVVLSAVFMLIGAVNTAFVGSNGILNRVAEDGILHESFRSLHRKYGTTYKIISSVAILQIVIIILSRGDVFLLGEAYAFGVLWSLTFNVLSIIVLRFKKYNEAREWEFPFNIKVGKYYVPLGLILVFLILLSTALINLLTKKIATVSGIIFSIFLYMIFSYSERKNEKKLNLIEEDKGFEEKINLTGKNDIEELAKQFNKDYKILVPVRNPNNLMHLKSVLEYADDSKSDIIVLYIKVQGGLESRGEPLIMEDDKEVIKQVILLAEKYGKTITPVFLYSNDPFYTITYFAAAMGANEIVMGVSGSMGADVQLEKIATFWGVIKKNESKSKTVVKVIWEQRTLTFNLN
jgi:amino acid transporter